MAMIRPATRSLRAVRCLRQPIRSSSVTTTAPFSSSRLSAPRAFSTSLHRSAGGHEHESQYDPPTGWLWGIRPGEKAEPEGWEWPMYVFCGMLVLTGVALAFKPDTSVSTWALEEARRRLEAEGILPDPEKENKQ